MTVDLGVLFPGERVLWSGEQVRRGRITVAHLPVLGMIAFAVAFAVVWQIGAWNASVAFRLIGLAVPVIGLASVVRMLLRELGTGRSYTVTDRRIVVSRKGVAHSAYLANLEPPVVARASSSTVGTIHFGAAPRFSAAMLQEQLQGTRKSVDLVEIERPEQVRDIIATAQHSQRT